MAVTAPLTLETLGAQQKGTGSMSFPPQRHAMRARSVVVFAAAAMLVSGSSCSAFWKEPPAMARRRKSWDPYEPGGRTAFNFHLSMNFESFGGEVRDFVESMGIGGMPQGMVFGLDLGARSGRTAVLAGYTHVIANAGDDEDDALNLRLRALTLTYEYLVPIGKSSAETGIPGIVNELAFSLIGIPHATMLDSQSNGWRKGMGLGVEVSLCHRMLVRLQTWKRWQFFFTRIGFGYRTVGFDEYETSGAGSVRVDDSLDSLYVTFAFDQRF